MRNTNCYKTGSNSKERRDEEAKPNKKIYANL